MKKSIINSTLLFSLLCIGSNCHETLSHDKSYSRHGKIILGTSLLGFGLYGGYKIYNYYNQPNFSIIENNPLKILNSINKTRSDLEKKAREENWDQIKDPNKFVDIYLATVHELEKKNSIFLLGECQDGEYCKFSRSSNSSYRKALEDNIISLLSCKLQSNSKNTIELTSFGSGGMFLDLMIMIKLLNKKPNASINLHVIDIQYHSYVTYRDIVHKTRNVKFNDTFNLTETKIDKDLQINFIMHECKFQQFISYLNKRYPLAKIGLHVHEDTRGYFKYIKDKKCALPDIIFAADIDNGIMMNSIYDYLDLCFEMLQKQPTVKNLLLGSSNKTRKVVLLSYDLKDDNNMIKVLIERFNKLRPKSAAINYTGKKRYLYSKEKSL